jgi:hypothetical protein
MYKLQTNKITGKVCSIWYQEKLMCIPLDPDNTDYQQFLKDWEAGATVLSSTGVPLPWGSDPS